MITAGIMSGRCEQAARVGWWRTALGDAGFMYALGHVAVATDASDFGHVREAGLELVSVFLGTLLAWEGCSDVLAGICLPKTNVALV